MPDYPNPLLTLHDRNPHLETLKYDQIEIVSTFGEPQAEYAAIRKSAGLMDLPQRGVIELTGKDRHAFLNNLVSNQVYDKQTRSPLPAGRWVGAFLLNLKGRVVCDLNVIELGERTLLEVDVRLADLLVKLFDRYLFAEQVKIVSLVGALHEIALHGPRVMEVLSAETGHQRIEAGECASLKIIGYDVTAWRDDVCGVPGLHLIVPSERASAIWEHLLTVHGREYAVNKRLLRPVGWAAFNTTRIENGRGLFGIDFELAEPSVPGAKASPTEETAARVPGVLPAETGLLNRAVSFTKGCYLGQEVVARMHARNVVARRLVGLRVADDALPLAGETVMDDQDNTIGLITSSTMSPVLSDAAIALAIVKKPFFEIGRSVRVLAEGQVRQAVVTALPFVGREG